MIAVIAVAVLIVVHQATVTLQRRRIDPFDVVVLADVVLFTMWVYAPLVDSALMLRLERDPDFGLSVIVGILFLYAGLHFAVPPAPPVLRQREHGRGSPVFPIILLVFVACAAAVVGSRLASSGASNLLMYLAAGRAAAVQASMNQEFTGSSSVQIMFIAQAMLLVWLAILLRSRRWVAATAVYLTLVVGTILVATTRLPVILTLLLPLFHLQKRRGAAFAVPAAAAAGVIVVALLFVLGVVRGAGVEGLRNAEIRPAEALHALRGNFAPMEGYGRLWDLRMERSLPLEYGLTYAYVPVTAVPRAIWPGKPYVSFEPRWTQRLFGAHFSEAAGAVGVWTFTPWGEGLVQFGLLGIPLNLFLFGCILGIGRRWVEVNPDLSMLWFYYGIVGATFLRSSTSALAWTLGLAVAAGALAYRFGDARVRVGVGSSRAAPSPAG